MSRRLVVVLFLDLVGWTPLAGRVDPEPLQLLLEQYYEVCCAAVEEHGGTVEKFIGDAVMAVFGADSSGEDDAAQALRAAFRIRAEAGGLASPGTDTAPLQVHCGVAAGEALVTRSSRAGLRVVGDVVNLAARLQAAAAAGEIVLDETAAHLARRHFALDRLGPLALKGKAESVPAFRAAGPLAEPAGAARDGGRMVDRGDERARLRAAYRDVLGERRGRTVAVLGPMGIGKTRLIRETVDGFGVDGGAPVAVFGTCPSYGLRENHAALLDVLDAVTRRSARSRELMQSDPRLAAVFARRPGTSPGPGLEEVAWAARELLAAAAAACPGGLVVVWDALECAGGSLLRLVGELAESLAGLPVLTICAARPELARLDPPWLRALPARDVIDVSPLSAADSAELVALLAAAGAGPEVAAHELEVLDRVAGYSAGNPLFIRLLLESPDPGRAAGSVPAGITAMVGAMIDRLPEPARDLLGAAAVIGSAFTAAELALLGEPAPPAALAALLEQGLVRATGTGAQYRFAQQPVHEVAYARLDKERRLAWHRRLAERGVSRAFHFEAAVRLLGDLRPHDPALPEAARRAARALLHEGTAALRQRDVPAAIGLLGRALELAPDDPQRSRAVAAIRLSDALMLSGQTRAAVDLVAGIAEQSPDEQVRLTCRVQQHLLGARLGAVPDRTVMALLAALEDGAADRLARCRFEQLRMLIHLGRGRYVAAERAAGAALEHSRAIGDVYEEDRMLAARCEVRQWSPAPIPEKLADCAWLAERFAADRFLLVPVLVARARCLALTGDRNGARDALAEAAAAVEQLRLTMGRVLIDQAAGLACALHGEHAEAERHYRAAAAALERAGQVPVALTLRVLAARELSRRRPGDGARQIAGLLERSGEMDVRGRILCTAAAVRLAAAEGTAHPLLGTVTALLADTDDPCLRGEARFDLAQAHRLLGDHAAARDRAAAAAADFAAVGATLPTERVLAWT